MTLLLKAPVWLRGDLCLPQRLEPVAPLQARDHQGVCRVHFAGKQRRRPNDPRQVSWSIHAALVDVAPCRKKHKNLVPLSRQFTFTPKKRCSSKVIGKAPASPEVGLNVISAIALIGASGLGFESVAAGTLSFFLFNGCSV